MMSRFGISVVGSKEGKKHVISRSRMTVKVPGEEKEHIVSYFRISIEGIASRAKDVIICLKNMLKDLDK